MNGAQSQVWTEPAGVSTPGPFSSALLMQACGALAAIFISIVGLAKIVPITLAGISAIIVGTVFWIIGLAHGWRGGQWLIPKAQRTEAAPLRSVGVSTEFLGGLAGIVLGILALLGISRDALLGAAVITLGAGVLLGGLLPQLHWFAGETQNRFPEAKTRIILFLILYAQVLLGLGAVGLGISAVVGLDPTVLVLVGLLCLGVAALASLITFGFKPVARV